MAIDRKRDVFLICAGLAAAAILAFGPVWQNGFLYYDDPGHITDNAAVKNGITWNGILWAFTTSFTHNSMPFTWLSHMLDCSLFGLNAKYHHLMSLALHIGSTIFLFLILKSMTGTFWRSAAAAVLFAVHPLNAEPIAWAAARNHVLGVLFCILTTGAYVRYTKTVNKLFYLLAIVFFELGLMCKPVVVMLPAVLLIIDFWPLRRFRHLALDEPAAVKPLGPRTFVKLVVEKLPFAALSLISGAVTFIFQRSGGLIEPWSVAPLSVRVKNAIVAYPSYLSKLFCPTDLAVLYPYPAEGPLLWKLILSGVILAGISISAIYFARRRPWLIAGWLWFLLVLLPSTGLVRPGICLIADRLAYFPAIGIFIVVSWAFSELVNKLHLSKTVCAVAAAIVVVSLTMVSRQQVKYWKNTITLYEHTLAVTENNYRIYHNYASSLAYEGRIDEAVSQYEKAIRINPRYEPSLDEVGQLYLQQGKTDKASECFERILRIFPQHPNAHYYLATILTIKGDYKGAIKHLQKALDARMNWPEAYYSLARVYYLAGKPKYTIRYCAEAVSIAPNYLAARLVLAYTLAEEGHYGAAVGQYYVALKQEPDRIYTLKSLAWILACVDDNKIRSPGTALKFAQRACELSSYKDPKVVAVLAIVYSSLGRFDDAVQTAQKAVDLATASNQNNLADEIRGNLRLYEARQPYRLVPATLKAGLEDTGYKVGDKK